MFNIRLEQYRNKLQLNKRQMANKLELKESYYNLIENGKRSPSKTVLNKIVAISGLSEEYWMYGIDKENINNYDFKTLSNALKTIIELNIVKNPDELFNENNCPADSLGRLLIEALKKDIDEMFRNKDS
jgi:transcriptional regulator with XRE-family HTH domain